MCNELGSYNNKPHRILYRFSLMNLIINRVNNAIGYHKTFIKKKWKLKLLNYHSFIYLTVKVTVEGDKSPKRQHVAPDH